MSRWRTWTPAAVGGVPVPAAATADEVPDWAAAEIERTGARFLSIGGRGLVAGVWSDLDSLKLRDALEAAGGAGVPVVYLDGPEVPTRYKGRAVPGDPVYLDVLGEMMTAAGNPWQVRDRRLTRR